MKTKESKKIAGKSAVDQAEGAFIRTANLGYPRIGVNRELKRALESFWKGVSSESALLDTARAIRKSNWLMQKSIGIDSIPSNDFSLYDQMLDMIAMVGAVPERFNFNGGEVGLGTYFAMARGAQEKEGSEGKSVPAMEMTKWLDTNYHYIVPELVKGMKFDLSSRKVFDQFIEARELGIKTRPVLIGPVTFLLFGKSRGDKFDTLDLLDELLPVYIKALKELKDLGAVSVQMDEPILVLQTSEATRQAVSKAYEAISRAVPELKICLATYFEALEENMAMVVGLPIDTLHVDLVRAPQQLRRLLQSAPASLALSLGVVDGRNIWRNDISQTLRNLREALSEQSDRRVWIAPSCSLIHVPIDLKMETALDREVFSWMSYAKQKLEEVEVIRLALFKGDRTVQKELDANQKAMESRRRSARARVTAVRDRVAEVRSRDMTRGTIEARRLLQRKRLALPMFPTTTIGSFPQTKEVRQARLAYRSGDLSGEQYRAFMQSNIKDAVRRQEAMGLDVLVHGEFERNDMVEYFGEQLEGFAFTLHGWVQSYGSRYVKPPVIFGDVSRPRPMTVEWFAFAQAQTALPMKGMLTGPITLLQWSFVRNDQPRSETARQIALAIRDEVQDLEKAGAKIIQIDEAAFREGLPLKKSGWKEYLSWAVQAFRLCSSGVRDETQIHTHMCYSEFNDIIEAIADMNADVISIETSRSQMDLLSVFVKFRYPSDIGPGLYDIHSPRIPNMDEMRGLLKKSVRVLPPSNIWLNPDCGLKTRSWEEATPALQAMVDTAREFRSLIGDTSGMLKKHQMRGLKNDKRAPTSRRRVTNRIKILEQTDKAIK